MNGSGRLRLPVGGKLRIDLLRHCVEATACAYIRGSDVSGLLRLEEAVMTKNLVSRCTPCSSRGLGYRVRFHERTRFSACSQPLYWQTPDTSWRCFYRRYVEVSIAYTLFALPSKHLKKESGAKNVAMDTSRVERPADAYLNTSRGCRETRATMVSWGMVSIGQVSWRE